LYHTRTSKKDVLEAFRTVMQVPTATPIKVENSKGVNTTPTKLVLCVIAVVTCMQLSFHSCIGTKIQQDDGECDGSTNSPYCAEAAIFKQWQAQANVNNIERMLVALPEPSDIGHFDQITTVGPIDVLEVLRAVSEVRLDALTTVAPERLVNAAASTEVSQRGSDSAMGQYVDSVLETGGNMSEIATTSDIWKAYEDPSTWDNMTDWARDVVELQGRLEQRMRNLKSVRRRQATESTTIVPPRSDAGMGHLTAWAKDLIALQAKLEGEKSAIALQRAVRLDEMAMRHQRRAQQATPTTTSKASLVDEIWSYGKELCRDPRRKDYAACVQFLDKPSERVDDRFRESHVEGAVKLNWTAVAKQHIGSIALRGAGGKLDFVKVSKRNLKHAKWVDKIPKVACVTVVPDSQDIKYQMKFFLDGFKNQNYEGEKQLVLVVHHENHGVKEMLKQYSDSSAIKVVTSMGHKGLSATAFRFGAFMSDADVIARYDFGAWHHPSRLAMQVRALALAKRPVSHLQTWTVRNYANGAYAKSPTLEEMKTLGEASVVGEKEWMSKYWYPYMGKESESWGQNTAELEMPELLVYSTEN